MMRVLHLSTSAVGGAAIAAQRLHSAMRGAGIDSLFASRGPAVGLECEHVLPLSRRDRWRSSFVTAADRAATGQAASFFSPFSGRFVDGEWIRSLAPDAVIVHNWFNLLGTSPAGFLSELALPTVVLMHDERLFTGGCHYSVGCPRYQQVCRGCPQAAGWARQLVVREQRAMAGRLPKQLVAVAPSRWLREQATRSALLRDQDVRHIPNTIDPDVFHPRLRAQARAALGLRDDELVLAWQPGKGDELVGPVLERIRNRIPDRRILLLHTGAEPLDFAEASAVGTLTSEPARADFWAAADIALSLTAFDNFPNIVLEALACGVPFVIPDVGGAGEAVRATGGGTVAAREPGQIADAVVELCESEEKRQRLSAAARQGVLSQYRPDMIVDQYLSLLS